MRWSSVKKGLSYTAAAYLALAVTGTFALMSFEAACFEDFAGKDTARGVFLTSLVQPVACPAINTAKNRPFSPPRQCLPRAALPAGFFAAGACLPSAAAGFIATASAQSPKNPVLLKLRI